MKLTLKQQWRTVPAWVRKPLIFVTGWMFIIAAGLTGWLPGPGGIPLFLVGIAILASEFHWAKRIKHQVLEIIHGMSRWYRHHKLLGNILLGLALGFALAFLVFAIRLLF